LRVGDPILKLPFGAKIKVCLKLFIYLFFSNNMFLVKKIINVIRQNKWKINKKRNL